MSSFWYESWGTYREFYQWNKRTLDWNMRRRECFTLAGWKCALCGQPWSKAQPLQADHLNYIRLGREVVSNDLRALCPSCHADITAAKRINQKGYPG